MESRKSISELMTVINRLPDLFINEIISNLNFGIGDYIEYVFYRDDGSFSKHRMKVTDIFVESCHVGGYTSIILRGNMINEKGILKNDRHEKYNDWLRLDGNKWSDSVDLTIQKMTEEDALAPYCSHINLIRYKVQGPYAIETSGTKCRKSLLSRYQVKIADFLKKKDYTGCIEFLLYDRMYSDSKDDGYEIIETSDVMVKYKINDKEFLTIWLLSEK